MASSRVLVMGYVWGKLEASWKTGDADDAKIWSRYYEALDSLTDEEYDSSESEKTPILKD